MENGLRWSVLGYDARERWCPRRRIFPSVRARTFLLRRDVEKVLSADVMVWPTVFADPDVAHLGLDDLQLGARGVARPEGVNGLQGLWRSLEQLEEALASLVDPLPGPYDVVALAAPSHPQPALAPAAPDRLDVGWLRVGYDVVDPWLLSGLSNCGYHEDELRALGDLWGEGLNRWHLFDDPGVADGFRELCDVRVPEHAPFMVCAVLVRD